MKHLFRSAVFTALLAAVVVLPLSGCSLFRSKTETVTITATPADSLLIVNGMMMGSPAVIEMPRDRNFTIQCMKEGFYPYIVNTTYHFNRTGTLDALGSIFVLPAIGLFSSGIWSLDQTEFNVVLSKK